MKRSSNHDWSPIRAAERPVERFSPHGRYRLALAYANSYHVAMSSLGFQRVYELVHRRPEWACERFFTDGDGMPLSVESGRALTTSAASPSRSPSRRTTSTCCRCSTAPASRCAAATAAPGTR